MKKFCILLIVLCCALEAHAQKEDILFRKNFPFTYLLEHSQQARELVSRDAVLSGIGEARYKAVAQANTRETALIRCKFRKKDREKLGLRLAALCESPVLRSLLDSLRKTGQYYIYNQLEDKDFVQAAWEQDARGMDRIIDVYALGARPRYAGIDSIDFRLGDENYIGAVRADALSNILTVGPDAPFYALSVAAALTWLDANGRWEAADYEPLEEGLNRLIPESVRNTRWEEYPYSVILVLGCGPERVQEAISPQGRLRARYAANLYKQGKAPFLVVSGGRVHPFKTPYSEADQMKKYLMEYCGIPESAIIAEPHARHTTTNIRNTVRLMLRFGIPLDKPALITSSESHIDYAVSKGFRKICLDQMLTVPFVLGERINGREVIFTPAESATQVANEDPLDP